jgi:L-ascorbate metabolism protein UlaG (beta-lactamase superfamily)
MLVSWHGHACVSIEFDSYIIVIDPHDGGSIGLKKPAVKGDLILITHDHFDHNAVNTVAKDKSRVLKMHYGETLIDNVKVTGLRTFHDKFKGKRRGENTVYLVEVRGFKLAHLGDLGEIPSEDVLGKIKEADLLVIPVGGTFTIEPSEAWSLVEKTKPINVMPIHYWIPGTTLPLKPVDEFIKHVKDYKVVKLDTNTFDPTLYRNSVIIPRPP